MNRILSFHANLTKKIISSIMLMAIVSFAGCGKYGSTTDHTSELIDPSQVEINAPTISYLNIDLTENVEGENSKMITAKQWLQAAQTFYKNKKYSRALRAAEESLTLSDSEEAYKIAMLSAINITQSNMDKYNNPDVLTDNDKQAIKSRLTKVTTAINTTEYSKNKSVNK